MEIARRTYELCLASSLSPSAITSHAGLTPGYQSRLKSGEEVPTWEILENLASLLDVPIERFFFDFDQPPATPRLTPRLTIQELERPAPWHQGPITRFKDFLMRIGGMEFLPGYPDSIRLLLFVFVVLNYYSALRVLSDSVLMGVAHLAMAVALLLEAAAICSSSWQASSSD
jgi:transcriptional regulator with XRE-family HTH domain